MTKNWYLSIQRTLQPPIWQFENMHEKCSMAIKEQEAQIGGDI